MKSIHTVLDVTVNLSTGKHYPYNKWSNVSLYNKEVQLSFFYCITQIANKRILDLTYEENAINYAKIFFESKALVYH